MPGDKGFDPLLLSNIVPLAWAREVGVASDHMPPSLHSSAAVDRPQSARPRQWLLDHAPTAALPD